VKCTVYISDAQSNSGKSTRVEFFKITWYTLVVLQCTGVWYPIYKIDNKKKVYVCKNTFGICIRCADRNEAELYPPLGVCTLVCTSLVVSSVVGWVFTSALVMLIEEPGTRLMNVHTIPHTTTKRKQEAPRLKKIQTLPPRLQCCRSGTFLLLYWCMLIFLLFY
jgi:hypothetical protein